MQTGTTGEQAKTKVGVQGVPETMLQTLFARAAESEKENHHIYDKKAIEIVSQLDYDFSKAESDKLMSSGVIARTIVLDRLVNDYLTKHPDAIVVNIACGLDTRFYRMDNGKLRWYNLDLPETIAVRDQIYQESGRVSTIGISALDPAWADQIDAQGKMLFIIEGLSMYLTPEENATMLEIIRDHFDNATVMMECLAKKWVNKEDIEESIQKTGAKFIFGADCFEDLGDVAKGFRKIKDDNITRGMTKIIPVLRPFGWLPIIRKMTQKILIFEKVQE